MVSPFPCNHLPSWYPLIVSGYVAFDEEEQPFLPPVFPVSERWPTLKAQPPAPPADQLPAEANRLKVGTENFAVPFDFGWIYLYLAVPRFVPPFGFSSQQGWAGVVMKAGGRFSVGFAGTPLSSGCDPNAQLPLIF